MLRARDVVHTLKRKYGFHCNYGEDEVGSYVVSSQNEINPRCVLTALNQIGVEVINCTDESSTYPKGCGYTIFYI